MKVYLVQGSSFMVPMDVVELYATASDAADGAAALVNILLGEVELPSDATAANWETKLVAALERRADELGIEIEDTHEDRGDALRHHLGEDGADVWISEENLRGAPAGAAIASAEDQEAAERWRALMSSQRMHFMGSAGFNHIPKDGDAASRLLVNQTPVPRDGQPLHFGMEFWDVAPADDRFPDTFERELMTVYVDTLRERSK